MASVAASDEVGDKAKAAAFDLVFKGGQNQEEGKGDVKKHFVQKSNCIWALIFELSARKTRNGYAALTQSS